MMGNLLKLKYLLAAIVSLVLLFGCATPDNQTEEPVWGKQPCAHCAMLLTEPGHGAQLVSKAGDRLFFDDLGCLVAWELERPNKFAYHWVRRQDGQGWLVADQAHYQRALHTPMDFGFVAVPGTGDADWPQVVAAVRRKLAQ